MLRNQLLIRASLSVCRTSCSSSHVSSLKTACCWDFEILFKSSFGPLSGKTIKNYIKYICNVTVHLTLTSFIEFVFYGMAAMPFPCNGILLIQSILPRVFLVFTLNCASFIFNFSFFYGKKKKCNQTANSDLHVKHLKE